MSWIVSVGILSLYLANRSFIIDEANLALNILEGNYPDFFANLKYEQFAPPLFLSISKFLTEIIGESDWVLRIPSLLAAIGLVWIMRRFLNDLEIDVWWISVVILMFGISFMFLRYATEFKQYMTDAMIAVYWIYWSNKRDFVLTNKKEAVWFAIGGIVSIWMSMAVVFILFGLGVVYMVHGFKERDYRMSLPISLWLISFILYYVSILRFDIGREGLLDTHEAFFADFEFWKVEAWRVNGNIFVNSLSSFFDPTVLSIAFGSLLLIIGFHKMYSAHRGLAMSVFCTVLAVVAASGLGLYSLLPRLIVFLLPLVWLIVGLATRGWSLRLIPIFIFWWILMANNGGLISFFSGGGEFEDIKSTLDYVGNTDVENTDLIVEAEGVPAFKFYGQTKYRNIWDRKILLGKRGVPLFESYESGRMSGRELILIFAHTFPRDKVEQEAQPFLSRYALIRLLEYPGASLIHLKK